MHLLLTSRLMLSRITPPLGCITYLPLQCMCQGYSSAYLDCLHSAHVRKEVMNCPLDDECRCCMTVSCVQHLTLPCMPQARYVLRCKTQAGTVHIRKEKMHVCFLKRKKGLSMRYIGNPATVHTATPVNAVVTTQADHTPTND